jgi:hypothetical protein
MPSPSTPILVLGAITEEMKIKTEKREKKMRLN